MYEMKVQEEMEQFVCLQLLGSDSGNRIFDVLIDGKRIDTIDLSKPCKEGKGLYRRYIHIPAEYIKARKNVTVKFQAKNGCIAGGIFDVRIVSAVSVQGI